jgi:hypothetical protein
VTGAGALLIGFALSWLVLVFWKEILTMIAVTVLALVFSGFIIVISQIAQVMPQSS